MASSTPNTAANRPFLVRFSDDIRLAIFDGVAFSRPSSLSAAAARFRRNVARFPVNYFMTLAFFGNPLNQLLVVLWLVLYLLRPSYSPPLFAVDGRPVSDWIVGLGIVALLFVAYCPLTLGSLLICTHLTALATAIVHAALRVPDESPVAEQGPRADGYLPPFLDRLMQFVMAVTFLYMIS